MHHKEYCFPFFYNDVRYPMCFTITNEATKSRFQISEGIYCLNVEKRKKAIQTTQSSQKLSSTKDKSSKNNNMNVSIDTFGGRILFCKI